MTTSAGWLIDVVAAAITLRLATAVLIIVVTVASRISRMLASTCIMQNIF